MVEHVAQVFASEVPFFNDHELAQVFDRIALPRCPVGNVHILGVIAQPVLVIAFHLLDLGFLLVPPGVRGADPRFEISVSRQALDLIHRLLDLKFQDVIFDALQDLLLVVDLLSLLR